MNQVVSILAIGVSFTMAMSVPNNKHSSAELRQEQLAALIKQLIREKQVYEEVKGELKALSALKNHELNSYNPSKRCAYFGDDSCATGGIPGAASDSDWLDGGWSPGKRCANFGDDGCATGGIPGANTDNDWLNGGFNPGKRCANLGDEGCANGGVPGAASDNEWLNGGGFNPGKRCANMGDEGCVNGGVMGAGSDADWLNGGFNPGK